MNWRNIKKTLKKTWLFIWESDSVWSWIVCIILAFVIIKFLVYPGLGLVFGTQYPIVAVVSESMEHNGDFDEWWLSDAVCNSSKCSQAEFYSSYNITKAQFQDFKFSSGFNKGDIIILFGTKPEKLKIGDILVFRAGKPDPIIHRIIKIENQNAKYYFTTKGDHNSRLITETWLNENNIPEEKILGRGVLKIPYLGWVKIGFVNLISLFR